MNKKRVLMGLLLVFLLLVGFHYINNSNELNEDEIITKGEVYNRFITLAVEKGTSNEFVKKLKADRLICKKDEPATREFTFNLISEFIDEVGLPEWETPKIPQYEELE